MSLLRPSDDDYAFAEAHADAGLKKALMRLNELADLLEEAGQVRGMPPELLAKIGAALLRTYGDAHYETAVRRPWQWERKRYGHR
jgi:hypothetical protein